MADTTPLEESRRDWEVIQQNDSDKTERLKIPQGWLYRTFTAGNHVALVFVPGK